MGELIENPIGPRPQSFLIGKNKGAPSDLNLGTVLAQLGAEPGVKVTRILGEANDPSNLVVEMCPERAEALKTAFGENLLVEKNTQLDWS